MLSNYRPSPSDDLGSQLAATEQNTGDLSWNIKASTVEWLCLTVSRRAQNLSPVSVLDSLRCFATLILHQTFQGELSLLTLPCCLHPCALCCLFGMGSQVERRRSQMIMNALLQVKLWGGERLCAISATAFLWPTEGEPLLLNPGLKHSTILPLSCVPQCTQTSSKHASLTVSESTTIELCPQLTWTSSKHTSAMESVTFFLSPHFYWWPQQKRLLSTFIPSSPASEGIPQPPSPHRSVHLAGCRLPIPQELSRQLP